MSIKQKGLISKRSSKTESGADCRKLSDDEGRYVVDVMAVLLDFDELSPNGISVVYLLDTHFLNTTNNRTVSISGQSLYGGL